MLEAKNRKDALAKAVANNKVVLLMACSPTCAECRAAEGLLKSTKPAVKQWLDRAYVLWRSNVTDKKDRAECEGFIKVGMALPVWVWIHKGKRVYRRAGLPPSNNLRLWLEVQAGKAFPELYGKPKKPSVKRKGEHVPPLWDL